MRRHVLAIISLIVTASFAAGCAYFLSRKNTTRAPAQAEPALPLTFERLTKLVNDGLVPDTTALLKQMPVADRERFALIYNSRSSQTGTCDAPRIILNTRNNLIVAIESTHATDEDPDRIEIIRQDPVTQDHEFYSYRLSPGPGRPAFPPEKNPAKCQTCHSTALHPNFDTYWEWPGAIGSFDTSSSNPFSKKEASCFDRFIENAANEPYLSLLAGLPTTTLPTMVDHNSALTDTLMEQMFKRIAKILVHHPKYAQYRGELFEAVKNPGEVVLAKPLLEGFSPEFLPVFKDTWAKLAAYEIKKASRQKAMNDDEDAFFRVRRSVADDGTYNGAYLLVTARVRFVVENKMGLSMKDWSITREADSYSFMTNHGGIMSLGRYLEEEERTR